MKIAHFADIHVAPSRIDEFKELLEDLANSIKEQNPDVVVFAGDAFIHRDRLTQMQVQLLRWFLLELLKDYEVIVAPGNHDATNAEDKVDSLTACFAHDSNMKIHTKVGSFLDIQDTRFHFFPYPSRNELNRLEIEDISEIFHDAKVLNAFDLAEDKHNVLVYHGTLENFKYGDDHVASEASIGVGKDMMVPETFWRKFDAVMAGHLHKYQAIGKAIYPGVPFPLNFADSDNTGWILWDDLEPTFIELEQLYPYMTIDVGT